MRYLATLLMFFGLSIPAFAQFTESPVTAECGKKCSGVLTLVNQGTTPLTFEVEHVQTTFVKGNDHPTYSVVEDGTSVKVNPTSGRLGPHEAIEIDYSVRCKELPCQITLLSGAMSGHTKEGLAVKMVLPFTIYSCEKQKGCRTAALTAAGFTVTAKK